MKEPQTYKPAVVIPAYRRRDSLARLLKSLNEAFFPSDDNHLIISIEGGADPEVVKAAKNFRFESGSVEIIEREDQLGIYRHIRECANFSDEYGSVIVLEDDLIVGPAFYEFACKSLSFYASEKSIAGISLYSQRFNETALLPFEALPGKWPVYFMQLGCSWGQAWTGEQWQDFLRWETANENNNLPGNSAVPPNVQEWPNTSWKKNFNKYLVDRDKYIVYPYSSFTTNSSEDMGVHMKNVGNRFHVPLNVSDRLGEPFVLPAFDDEIIKYDSFMEPKSKILEKWTGLSHQETEIDLYGSKPLEYLSKKKFVITSKKGGTPIRTFPLSFRPLELNLKFDFQDGRDSFFYLYETNGLKINQRLSDAQYFHLAEYFSYFEMKTKRFAVNFFSKILVEIVKRLKLYFK